MNVKLSFLGGAGTVTGSKYLVENRGTSGSRRLRPVPGLQGASAQELGAASRSIRAASTPSFSPMLISTIPAICRCWSSAASPVRCSAPMQRPICARSCCPTSGHLQEKDAEFANRHGFSKHKPALPLYTEEDARTRPRRYLTPMPFDQDQTLPGGAAIRLRRAGHILGAASIQLDWAGTTIVFSGDLGRYDDADNGRSGARRSRRLSAGRIRPTAIAVIESAIRQMPSMRSSARQCAAAERSSSRPLRSGGRKV